MKSLPILSALLFLFVVVGCPADTGTVRPAAVAGSWYPGDADTLASYLDGLLDGAAPEGRGRVIALISPHAGYPFSGATATQGMGELRGRTYRRVIVLGPSHRGGFRGLSIAEVSAYETPLGRIPLDLAAVQRLRGSTLVTADAQAHRREHSIEMQLPLLQRALQPGWKLLPILVGNLQPGDDRTIADLLRPLLDDETLLLVSSDFTHYGPNYDYLPFPLDDDTAAHIDALDQGAVQRILAKDPKGFLDYQARTGITICGFRPIAILLNLLPADAVGSVIARTSSGKLTGGYRNSVSYYSIGFRAPGDPVEPPDPPPAQADSGGLPDTDMQLLHAIASRAVEAAARPRDEAPMRRLEHLLDQVPPALETPSGAFVTLKREGRLRGCIGYIRPIRPLFEAVAENGINAARNDRRFMPLRPDELDGLEVEVSVLTPPQAVDSWQDFRVGEEGVILEKDGRSAVFLPEVATEQGWGRERTLTELARKAGLPGDAWREGARFKTFRSQKYSAPYAAP